MKKQAWKKAKNYAYTRKLTRWDWPWEFARRNPEYMEDWESEVGLYEKALREEDTAYLMLKVMTHGVEGRFPKPSDPDFQMQSPRELRQKWGFGPMFNPSRPAPVPIVLCGRGEFAGGVLSDLAALRAMSSDLSPEQSAAFRAGILDLRIPIGPQVKRIEKTANYHVKRLQQTGELQRTRPEISGHKIWTPYLRVLDARLEGASHKEITEILFPDYAGDDKKSINTHQQAKELTKPEKYLALLGLPTE